MRLAAPLRSLFALGTAVVGSLAASSPSSFALKQGKLVVSSSGGVEDASYALKPPSPFPHVELPDRSSLKLTFSIVDASGSPSAPEHAHLLLEDLARGQEAMLHVNLKANGKASFVLNTASPPPPLLPLSPSLNLTLLLSSPRSPTIHPLAYPLGSILLPAHPARAPKVPRAAPRDPSFTAQGEIYPTIPPPERSVPVIISLAGVVAVLAPWLVLVSLLSSLSRSTLRLSSPSGASSLFLIALAGTEALLGTYWVCLRLYHLLPALAVAAVLTAWTGRGALRALKEPAL